VPRTLLAMVDGYSREPLVDLDRPVPPRPERDPGAVLRTGWRRVRTARPQVGAVALAAVVGAVAGGVAVHRWEDRQERAAQASTVTVRAQLLDSTNLSGTSDATNASVVTNLTLVNLGPLPIDVLDLEADRDGLGFRNAAQEFTVRPGFRTIAVWVTFACRNRTIANEPLTLHMQVRTADGRTRSVETAVEIGGQWPGFLENLCREEWS